MPLPIGVVYTITDSKAKESTTIIKIPSSLAPADWIAYARTMAPLISAVTTGGITYVGLAIGVDMGGVIYRTSPVLGSDVEEGARFNWRDADGRPAANRIATFTEDYVDLDSRSVDIAEPDVAAFVGAIRNGLDITGEGGSGVVGAVSNADVDIDFLASALESFTASRKN